jgi:hypothetical protein
MYDTSVTSVAEAEATWAWAKDVADHEVRFQAMSGE